MNEKVSVVVVSRNTRELTLRCVLALLASEGVDLEVVVADNGSWDGSADLLEGVSPRVRVLRLGGNLGFGAANNRGMQCCSAGKIALVNSDAFVEPGALRRMAQFLNRNPSVGVVGPQLLNADGTHQESCFQFPTPLRAWMENLGLSWCWKRFRRGEVEFGCKSVDWVSGACLMLRREVLERVGGFDEKFFLYSEETDWQYRMRQAGWRIWWISDSRVTHLGGASGGGTKDHRVREFFFEGLDRYFRKHFGILGVWNLRAATSVGAFLRLFASPVRRAPNWDGGWGWILVRQLTRSFPS